MNKAERITAARNRKRILGLRPSECCNQRTLVGFIRARGYVTLARNGSAHVCKPRNAPVFDALERAMGGTSA